MKIVKIQWFRSATVGISTYAGTSVLCDPWITDGAFIGSWYHWPPLEGFEFDALLEKRWDGIYISHFHADHFDRKWLASLLRRQPEVRVVIPNYQNKWLKRAVLNCGLSPCRLIEARSGEYVKLGDLDIRVFVADYCDPTICGSSLSCGSTPRRKSANDSVALFEADDQKILNANDALAVQSAHRLWPLIGQVDLLLGHFGGAGPFPQCFTDLDQHEKLRKAKSTGWVFVNRLAQTAERLQARFTLPYAGQYVLGGSLHELNDFRSIIPMQEVLSSLGSGGATTPISLAPFGEFDLSLESLGEEWREPERGVYERYLKKIGKILFPYQRASEEWDGGTEILRLALARVKHEFESFVNEGGSGSSSSITVKAGDIAETINFGSKSAFMSNEPNFENHTTISCDPRLLRRLLVRRPGYRGFTAYHFNQAEIGSHLAWTRNGPYANETQFLNFMHAEVN